MNELNKLQSLVDHQTAIEITDKILRYKYVEMGVGMGFALLFFVLIGLFFYYLTHND